MCYFVNSLFMRDTCISHDNFCKSHVKDKMAVSAKSTVRSPVFSHFLEPVQAEHDGIFKPKCKHCDNDVSMKGKGTSNLITHLKVYTEYYTALIIN